MAHSEASSRTLRLVEKPAPASVRGPVTEAHASCPHYRMQSTGPRPLAVCGAMPMFAPISHARAQSHCLSATFESCPHFVYRADSEDRERAEAEPVAVAKRWTFQALRESGWVVGIPLGLMIIIVIALLLTQ